MKLNKSLLISFVAPFMILISFFGLTLSEDSKKIFYMPIGLMGIVIILEKEFSRKLNRRSILKKIKYFQKAK